VIETGSFETLVEQGGRFAELAQAQFMAGAERPLKPAVKAKKPLAGV
jgi:ATP-binding cassette subfamily B protein